MSELWEKGKNFSRNRPRDERNEADFYQTPHCLTDEFIKAHVLTKWAFGTEIADLCTGEGAIVDVIGKYPYEVFAVDIKHGTNIFDCKDEIQFDFGIMNPPFRLFNKWAEKCFNIFSTEFALLAPTTYLQGLGRFNKNGTGIFQNKTWPLTHIYTFNRYTMLSMELRPDGLIKTGMQSLSWFVWTKWDMPEGFTGNTIHRWLDIDQYVLRKSKKVKI
jgi:hypothetical protein